MRVAVLDARGEVVHGFSESDCVPLRTNNTLAGVYWRDGNDLSKLAGQTVKFRFTLREARLFALWVSADDSGSSSGYVGAGGPGYTSARDTVGINAYRYCCRPATW
jgi:hypothetical protein